MFDVILAGGGGGGGWRCAAGQLDMVLRGGWNGVGGCLSAEEEWQWRGEGL